MKSHVCLLMNNQSRRSAISGRMSWWIMGMNPIWWGHESMDNIWNYVITKWENHRMMLLLPSFAYQTPESLVRLRSDYCVPYARKLNNKIMTKKLSFLSYGLYYKVYIHGQFCFSQYLMFLKVFLENLFKVVCHVYKSVLSV